MIYVSAQRGDDANTGTLAAPCREISKAVELSAGGEISCVLDSGHYAQFSVSKSLTVVGKASTPKSLLVPRPLATLPF
jgi:hypothetical protein